MKLKIKKRLQPIQMSQNEVNKIATIHQRLKSVNIINILILGPFDAETILALVPSHEISSSVSNCGKFRPFKYKL